MRCIRAAAAVMVAATFGCVRDPSAVPEGAVAVVGPTVLTREDVAAAYSGVGEYGQLRFSGEDGEAALVEALVTTQLLALAAADAGFADDPRVQFAVDEEAAMLFMAAEVERRSPRANVEADEQALRAYFHQHAALFAKPQRRSAQGVVFDSFDAADAALAKLRRGDVELRALGDIVATPLMPRDDHEFPGFHRYLFADGIEQGDWMEHPVFVGESLLVGRVQAVEPGAVLPWDDPAVRERVVEAVWEPLRAAAMREVLLELGVDPAGLDALVGTD